MEGISCPLGCVVYLPLPSAEFCPGLGLPALLIFVPGLYPGLTFLIFRRLLVSRQALGFRQVGGFGVNIVPGGEVGVLRLLLRRF
mgnify:CR=1 FL=1